MNPKPGFECAARRAGRWARKAAVWAVWLVALAAFQGGAQAPSGGGFPGVSTQGPQGRQFGNRQDGTSDISPFEDAKRLRALNAERQRSLVADTEKLLRLVSELHEEIVASDADSLTPVQLRKLAEIEKLAHNVKEKMSTSPVSTPVYRQPLLPIR